MIHVPGAAGLPTPASRAWSSNWRPRGAGSRFADSAKRVRINVYTSRHSHLRAAPLSICGRAFSSAAGSPGPERRALARDQGTRGRRLRRRARTRLRCTHCLTGPSSTTTPDPVLVERGGPRANSGLQSSPGRSDASPLPPRWEALGCTRRCTRGGVAPKRRCALLARAADRRRA